jgi:DNA-binding protein
LTPPKVKTVTVKGVAVHRAVGVAAMVKLAFMPQHG